MIPVCLLVFSCTSTMNIEWPQRRCMVAGHPVDCETIPQIDYDKERDEENHPYMDHFKVRTTYT